MEASTFGDVYLKNCCRGEFGSKEFGAVEFGVVELGLVILIGAFEFGGGKPVCAFAIPNESIVNIDNSESSITTSTTESNISTATITLTPLILINAWIFIYIISSVKSFIIRVRNSIERFSRTSQITSKF
jgi:hypothetical protein